MLYEVITGILLALLRPGLPLGLDGYLEELGDQHAALLDDPLYDVLAFLHLLRQLHLLLGGQEVLLAYLAEVQPYRVVDGAFLVVVDEALLFLGRRGFRFRFSYNFV